MGKHKLYGLCREMGFCLPDCQLCARIGPVDSRAQGSGTSRPGVLTDAEAAEAAKFYRQGPCQNCGKIRRSNHVCHGPRKSIIVTRCAWCFEIAEKDHSCTGLEGR